MEEKPAKKIAKKPGRKPIGSRIAVNVSDEDREIAQYIATNGQIATGIREALHACALLGVEVTRTLAQQYAKTRGKSSIEESASV